LYLLQLGFAWENRSVDKEFAKDEADGPDIDCFGVVTASKEDFWGTVPRIRVEGFGEYQTVTT
jgi:hypothetical protein